jgi:hypothetical protein
MKIQDVQNKLAALKEIINRINPNVIELIETSAELEIKLRKPGCSKLELTIIDDELDRLINKYSNIFKQ